MNASLAESFGIGTGETCSSIPYASRMDCPPYKYPPSQFSLASCAKLVGVWTLSSLKRRLLRLYKKLDRNGYSPRWRHCLRNSRYNPSLLSDRYTNYDFSPSSTPSGSVYSNVQRGKEGNAGHSCIGCLGGTGVPTKATSSVLLAMDVSEWAAALLRLQQRIKDLDRR